MTVTGVETRTSDEPATLVAPRRTRIDPPHPAAQDRPALDAQGATEQPLGAEIVNPFITADSSQPMLEVEEPTAEMIAAVTGQNLELRREQLQLQVAQLTGHLRIRLREVDRRGATLTSRVGQLDSDVVTHGLWLPARE